MRAPFNILAIPFFRREGDLPLFRVLRRADAAYWQWVTGGGEDDETPLQAARCETWEETGLEGVMYRLDMRSDVPKTEFASAHRHWPKNLYMIPHHMFAVEASSQAVHLSHEHTDFHWLHYEQVYELLFWQSNQLAILELSARIEQNDLMLAESIAAG